MLFFWRFLLLVGKRTRDFACVSLRYGRSGEEICTGYAMAASGRMQYDYKQTNLQYVVIVCLHTLLLHPTEDIFVVITHCKQEVGIDL